MSFLANSTRRIEICYLAGVTQVELHGSVIRGQWSEAPKRLYSRPAGTVAQIFANWRTDEKAVLKFTTKYGPLRASRPKGKRFAFEVEDWRTDQLALRRIWDFAAVEQLKGTHFNWQPLPSDEFVFENGKLAYVFGQLKELLTFDLLSTPVHRIRRCKSAEINCSEPYFIARDLRQQFCSDLCKAVGQRAAKLNWWNEHGQAWRSKRLKKR